MSKFVMVTCLPGKEESNFGDIQNIIEQTFKQDKDVVVLNINNVNDEVIQKFVNSGLIDCFVFTPETLDSGKTRRMVPTVLNADYTLKKNTQFLNIYNSHNEKEVEKSSTLGSLLLNPNYRTTLSQFDINSNNDIFSQNLIGIKNSSIKQRETLQEKDKYVFEIIGNILNEIEFGKDEYTSKHIRSVCVIAEAIAHELGIKEEDIDILKVGALLHDVGKQDISTDILKKPTRLTDDEFIKMKDHVLLGEIELNNFDLGEFERAKCIAAEHHERFDGKGYPRGIKGEEIDILSRIVTVADSVQAMFGRSYQMGKTKNELVSELERNSGTQFDPNITSALINILENKPQELYVNIDKEGNILYNVPTTEDLIKEANDYKNNRNEGNNQPYERN